MISGYGSSVSRCKSSCLNVDLLQGLKLQNSVSFFLLTKFSPLSTENYYSSNNLTMDLRFFTFTVDFFSVPLKT